MVVYEGVSITDKKPGLNHGVELSADREAKVASD